MIDAPKADALLSDVYQILSRFGLRSFLIDGTLLGLVREGDYIAHDTDVDLGVFAEEWNVEIVGEVVKAMMMQKIMIKHMFGNFADHFEMTLFRDNLKCDLFFYRRERKWRIFHAFKNGGKKLPDDVITYEYPAEMIENLSLTSFRGSMYSIPSNYLGVLEYKYGNWRVPIKNWDWQYGPRNVRK